MTPLGVRHLAELSYLACNCPVCSKYTVSSFASLPKAERIGALGLHNLYVLQSEVASSKQAIKEGRLWEYVSMKARGHPKLLEAMARLGEGGGLLLEGTPVTKAKALMLFDSLDYSRPELNRFRENVARRWAPEEGSLVVL